MTTTYAYEVLWQCDFAVLAYSRYVASKQRYEQGQFENQDGIEIYSAVQGILTAAASISKLLWVTIPSENPRASGLSDEAYAAQRSFSIERAAALRHALSVPKDSMLQNRQVRNAVEHFDERLDSHIFNAAGPVTDAKYRSVQFG